MSNLLQITDALHKYILANSLSEPNSLFKLREETSKMPEARMMTMPDQAQFIYFLLKLISAKNVIEIGVFTGYSTAWIAHALPQDGKLIACDIDERWPQIGRPYWQELGVDSRIDLRIGDAALTLETLLNHGTGKFDAVYIDADKASYDSYYEKALLLIRQGGIIIFDNLLWSGKVADESTQDKITNSIQRLTKKLHQDTRVYFSLITIADGMGLVLKK